MAAAGRAHPRGRLQAGDGHLGRMLDGEPVPDRRGLAAFQREVPGELAEVVLLGRVRAGFPQPNLDIAVRGYRDVVMNAYLGRPRLMIFHRDLVGDVNDACASDHGLGRAAAAQFAFDPDLVVYSELQLELLASRDGLQGGLSDEPGVMEDTGGA